VSTNANAWEEAYLRFETPAEEERKFTRRLRAAGALKWSRDALVLDLFSGRGGGARALRSLGFSRVVSLDLSPALVSGRSDRAACSVADCRSLPIATHSIDIVIVQGGLHHLPEIPRDLVVVLREVVRVLKPSGTFVAVEPWSTPFLELVHRVCEWRFARRLSNKIDALATMIELERSTYDQWLSRGPEIIKSLERYLVSRRSRMALGKLHYVGTPREGAITRSSAAPPTLLGAS
jgi:SAM-dependent methyltransferase